MSRAEYQRSYRKSRKEREPSWESDNWRKKYEKARSAVNSIKLERGCFICGYNKSVAALHFHHVDPVQKKDKDQIVARLVSAGRVSAALKEVEKCVVVCANCHAELHEQARNASVV